jgi:hypothetical protein
MQMDESQREKGLRRERDSTIKRKKYHQKIEVASSTDGGRGWRESLDKSLVRN